MALIEFDPNTCSKCGTCILCCPANIIAQHDDSSYPKIIDESDCLRCGHCAAVCPTGAVIHGDYPDGTLFKVDRDLISSVDQICETLRTRRSIRAYQDKPVEKEKIERILDGARFAPSAHNSQSTEYVVIQNRETLKDIVNLTAQYLTKMIKLFRNPVMKTYLLMSNRQETEDTLKLLPQIEELVEAVRKRNDLIIYDAPVLILAHTKKRVLFGDVNAHLALQNASLVAHSLGLGSFYTGFILAACERDKSIPKYLNLPVNHQVYGGLAIGYPKYRYNKWMERKKPKVRWM
ncbi:nitroreductase family protein [bacterium]|nr:nitroreductase family protein [bacterium]MBU1024846.1 nitroreductase family protein [bacterium]